MGGGVLRRLVGAGHHSMAMYPGSSTITLGGLLVAMVGGPSSKSNVDPAACASTRMRSPLPSRSVAARIAAGNRRGSKAPRTLASGASPTIPECSGRRPAPHDGRGVVRSLIMFASALPMSRPS